MSSSSDLGLDVATLPTIITSHAVAPPFVPTSLQRPTSHLAPPLSRSPSASRRAGSRRTRRPHTSDGGAAETDSVSASFAAAAAAQAQALSRQASVDSLTASLAAVSAQRRARLSSLVAAQPPSESPSTPLPPVPAVPHHIPASPVLVSPSARTAADSPFRCKTCSKHAWDASSSHAIGERCLHMRTRKRPSTTPERSTDNGTAPPPAFGAPRLAAELSGRPAPSRFELRAQDAERRAQAQRSPTSRSPKRTSPLQQAPPQVSTMSRTKSLDLSRGARNSVVDAPVDVLPEDAAETAASDGLGLDLSPTQPRGRKHMSQASESKSLRFHVPAQQRSAESSAHSYPRTPAPLDGAHGLALAGVEHGASHGGPESVLYLPLSPRFSSSTSHSMPMFTPDGVDVKDDYFDLPGKAPQRSSKTFDDVGSRAKMAQSASMHGLPLVCPQPARVARTAAAPRQGPLPAATSILQEQEQIVGYSLTPAGSPKSPTLSLSSVSPEGSPRSGAWRSLHRAPSTPPTTPPTSPGSRHGSLKSPRHAVPSVPSSPAREAELRLPGSPGAKEKAPAVPAGKTPPARLVRPISEQSVFQYNATQGSAAQSEKHDVGRKRGFWAGLNCFG